MKNRVALILFLALLLISAAALTRRSYYSENHPILNKIKENFGRLNPEWRKIPLRKGKSSFTEDKSVITLCIENPDTGKYYDMNTLMYVALHELAHVNSSEIGHGEEFKKKFSELLRNAKNAGIYNPSIPIPLTYCGMHH